MALRNYAEGDWVLIPVSRTFVGAALVARGTKGSTPFLYVFGRWSEPPTLDQLGGLSAADAVFWCRTYDRAIRTGEWPLLKRESSWKRDSWPMPRFGMTLGELAWKRTMSDDDPSIQLSEREATVEEVEGLPLDGEIAWSQIYLAIDPSWSPPLDDQSGRESEPPLLNVFFLADDEYKAVALCSALEDKGWKCASTIVAVEQGGSEVAIDATRLRPRVTFEELQELDLEMEALAASLGVTYDGHGLQM